MSDTKFWLVWNPYGYAPTHRHVTWASAVNKAERIWLHPHFAAAAELSPYPEEEGGIEYVRADVVEGLVDALREIRDLQSEPFDFPSDWQEQVNDCPECKRYRGHPIQQGICDTHRQPLWARDRHRQTELVAIGYRAKHMADAALRAAEAGATREEADDA